MSNFIPPAELARERQQTELASAIARHARPATKVPPTTRYDALLRAPRHVADRLCDAEIAAGAAHFQSRYDEAFRLHGVAAPPIRSDESLGRYRQRLANNLRLYSEGAFKHVDFSRFDAAQLGAVEQLLIDQTVADFKRPVGPLRELVEHDLVGRRLIRFYGDPQNCWGAFKAKPQYVIGWNPRGYGKGADAPGANRPLGTLMADGSVRQRV
jgi:hypothetical protein